VYEVSGLFDASGFTGWVLRSLVGPYCLLWPTVKTAENELRVSEDRRKAEGARYVKISFERFRCVLCSL
jgi:hypothetical protein